MLVDKLSNLITPINSMHLGNGCYPALPCRSSVSGKGRVSTCLEPFAAVVAKGGFGSRRAERFPPTLPANFYIQKAMSVPPQCVLCRNPSERGFNSTGIAIGFLELAVQLRGIMHFHANYVSTSVFGDRDYYQVTFEAEQDTDGPDSPYLLIQRQFEDSDDNWCHIETQVEKYCRYFLLRRVDFAPQKLSIEIDRPRDNLISVTFAMAATEFAEADHQWRS
jgi:hypothetical protein